MKPYYLFIVYLIFLFGCTSKENPKREKIRVIFDTDTNNELDDQHALAYLLFNQAIFKIETITINTTSSGGNIDKQYAEARRVLQLCDADTLHVLKGADKSFIEILPTIDSVSYDGKNAVETIIKTALEPSQEKLTIIAVGKLSNIALAIAKEPSIVKNIRLVWLGSNYPEPGEHNQNNDTVAMNYILNSNIDFEIATVRYGKPSGTDAVKITKDEINKLMPGLGPHISNPVTGRHGGEFYCFGDYSVNLFDHIDYHGDHPSRSLFDMAAVAIVKNPDWAQPTTIPAPLYVDGHWIERPDNNHKIILWENFDKQLILADFFASLNSQ